MRKFYVGIHFTLLHKKTTFWLQYDDNPKRETSLNE